MRQGSSFILLHVNVQQAHHHLLKRLFFPPLSGFKHPVLQHKNQFTIQARVYFRILSCIPLMYVIFMPVPQCLDYCCFILGFKIRKCESFSFFILLKMVLAILVPLSFNMNFRINLKFLQRSQVGFRQYYTEFVDQLGEYSHLSSVKSSNIQTEDVFPFIEIFFNFFNNVLQFSQCVFCTLLHVFLSICSLMLL